MNYSVVPARPVQTEREADNSDSEILRKPPNEVDHVMITVFRGFMNSHVVSRTAKVRY